LGVGFERCEDKGKKNVPKFVPTSNYHKEEETIKSTKTHYPSNSKSSFNSKREVRKETLKPREEAFVCIFCDRASHLDEFYFRHKRIEKRRFDYARNSIAMSLLISRFVLIFVLRLVSFMDLTIAHMILVHERTTLCLDTLGTTHVLIVAIISDVGTIFQLEGLTLTLSLDTWMVHVFPIVVDVPLIQVVRCKRL
jgi:hypothetical protein